MSSAPSPSRAGLFYGLAAYAMWGVFPLYFRAVSHVSPWTILCHRIVWSALLLAGLASLLGQWREVWRHFTRPRTLQMLALGAVLISANWLIFIVAITRGHVLESSLGYFINPLVSIALGMVFLHERLRPWQWAAVGIAALGVANLGLRGDHFPWIAVSLATTFGLYGLVRKKVDINSLQALLIETMILGPAAFAALCFFPRPADPATFGLLSLSGLITAVPLLCFGAAVRRLRLSTMGFLQYLGPTLQFILALTVFEEPLDSAKLTSFCLCWVAIVIYLADSLRGAGSPPVVEDPD